jgi:hypothetical protein
VRDIAEAHIAQRFPDLRIEEIPFLFRDILEKISELKWLLAALCTYSLANNLGSNFVMSETPQSMLTHGSVTSHANVFNIMHPYHVPGLTYDHYYHALYSGMGHHKEIADYDPVCALWALKVHRCSPHLQSQVILKRKGKSKNYGFGVKQLTFFKYLRGDATIDDLDFSLLREALGTNEALAIATKRLKENAEAEQP